MVRVSFRQFHLRLAVCPRALALGALILAIAGCDEGVFIGGAGGATATSADGGGGGDGGDGGEGGGTGSSSSTTTEEPLFMDPPEGSFPCGSSYCMAATHYCAVNVDGPCCGSSSACLPLPTICDTFGTICTCIQNQECPCTGAPGSCGIEGLEVECEQAEVTGAVSVTCLHP